MYPAQHSRKKREIQFKPQSSPRETAQVSTFPQSEILITYEKSVLIHRFTVQFIEMHARSEKDQYTCAFSDFRHNFSHLFHIIFKYIQLFSNYSVF